MKKYALFRYGKQISKAHPHKLTCIIEAYEQHLVWSGSPDFGGDGFPDAFIEDIKVLEVEDTEDEER